MGRTLVVYQFGLAVSLLVTTLAAAIAWRNRDERGGAALAVLLAGATVWTATTLVGTLVPGTRAAVVASKVGVTGVVVMVATLLVFALEYTGRGDSVRRETVALLAVEPAAEIARNHGWSVAALDADGGARIEVRTAERAQKTSTVD